MNEVFVLGAGFSKAFNDQCPLMVDFFRDQKALFERDEFADAREFAHRNGLDFESLNIEHVLSLVAMQKPWQPTVDKLRDQIAADQFVQLIAERINNAWPRPLERERFKLESRLRNVLSDFATYLCRPDTTRNVISFNYDLCIDNALETCPQKNLVKVAGHTPTRRRFDIGLSYGFWGQGTPHLGMSTNPNDPNANLIREGQWSEIVRVLKLHGSLNWWVQKSFGNPVYPRDVFAETTKLSRLASPTSQRFYESRPLIVAPVLEKSTVIDKPVLNIVWGQAAELLEQAQKVTFIGYSMPLSDTHAEYLFRSYCRAPEIVVASVKDGATATEDRYKSVFGEGRLTFKLDGAVAYCDALIAKESDSSEVLA